MSKKNKERTKVNKFLRADKSKKCISIQFDQGKYYSNEWLTEEEAEDLILKLRNSIDGPHE